MSTLGETIKRQFDWSQWFRGLIAAVVGSVGNAIPLIIIDPANFNVFDEGSWSKLGSFCLASAVLSAALYLKTHPIQED